MKKLVYVDEDGYLNKIGKARLRKLLKAIKGSINYLDEVVGKEWTKELKEEVKQIEDHFESKFK